MKGFTLIELLVVVVIIGILASIALPQYEMVVEKARASEALINVKAIKDAMQRHFQEFPDQDTITNCTQIADVQLKGGTWDTSNSQYCTAGGTEFTTENFIYRLGLTEGDQFEVARRASNSYTMVYNTQGELDQASSSCYSDYAQVCRLFGYESND